jgi:hypothetical protein
MVSKQSTINNQQSKNDTKKQSGITEQSRSGARKNFK